MVSNGGEVGRDEGGGGGEDDGMIEVRIRMIMVELIMLNRRLGVILVVETYDTSLFLIC